MKMRRLFAVGVAVAAITTPDLDERVRVGP
jgi:hypothetical protein